MKTFFKKTWNFFLHYFFSSRALCSHLRVSEEKSLAKEDITVQVRSGSGTETSPGGIRGGGGLAGHHQAIQPHPFQAKKNFTTFAALNKKVVEPSTPDTSRSSSSSLILQPAVEEQDKQIDFLENKPVEVGENVDVVESSLVDNNKFISSSSSDDQDQESIITPKFVVVDDPNDLEDELTLNQKLSSIENFLRLSSGPMLAENDEDENISRNRRANIRQVDKYFVNSIQNAKNLQIFFDH